MSCSLNSLKQVIGVLKGGHMSFHVCWKARA